MKRHIIAMVMVTGICLMAAGCGNTNSTDRPAETGTSSVSYSDPAIESGSVENAHGSSSLETDIIEQPVADPETAESEGMGDGALEDEEKSEDDADTPGSEETTSGISDSDSTFEYTNDKEELENAILEMETLRKSKYYRELDEDVKKAEIENYLNYLAGMGFIQGSTIYYDELTGKFTFAMRDGLTGMIEIYALSDTPDNGSGLSSDTDSISDATASSGINAESDTEETED